MPHPAWVLGCEDESWWSRVAPPACHAWADDQPLRLVAQTVAKDDPDPKALACYGIIVRTWTDTGQRQQESWLRCVGVRIVPCPLPIKGPRFHPIEPPGSMARAKVAEADRLLSADEMTELMHAVFGCPREVHLCIPDQAA